MNSKIITEYYNPLLEKSSFLPAACGERFCGAGSCWRLSPALGEGDYWIYAQKDLFDIKIHNFYFHEDFFLNFDIPECISISRYDSISGEQLNPYRRLSAGTIQTIVGGGRQYKALIHRRIPVHSVGIEIFPAYYEDYLKKQFPEEYFDLSAAFSSVDQSENFPAMSKLLFEIESYRGEGMAAGLFYEAKVAEAIALVANEQKNQSRKAERPLSPGDLAGLENVVSYIGDRYAFDIPLEWLAGIACMSATKLKNCFKRWQGCTVTEYVQARRMSQAEHLLIDTDFTMGQIAQMIGYSTSSRFAELFRKSTGILPIEYRRLAREK